MSFTLKLRNKILANSGSVKDSLLGGEHKLSPLMIHMLANIYFSFKYAEKHNKSDKYLYAEIGPYKPYSQRTVNSLIERGLIKVSESHCNGNVLYIEATDFNNSVYERAYCELGQFDKDMLRPNNQKNQANN